MTLSRLDPFPILRGHWRGLTRGDRTGTVADLGVRAVIIATLLLWIPALVFHWKLAAPDAMLAGVSLLAGALLSAFGFLATVRLRLQDRDPRSGTGTQRAKDLMDEAVAHLLAATLACLADAVVLTIGMNMTKDPKGIVGGVTAAIAISISGYLVVTFLMLTTRLYAAYVDAVRPRDTLNGLVSASAVEDRRVA